MFYIVYKTLQYPNQHGIVHNFNRWWYDKKESKIDRKGGSYAYV